MNNIHSGMTRDKVDPALLGKDDDGRSSVIIEVDVPVYQIRRMRSASGEFRPANSRVFVNVGAVDEREFSRRVAEVAKLVQKVSRRRPTLIGNAGAVIAELNAKEISTLAQSSLVRRVLLNRNHGVELLA